MVEELEVKDTVGLSDKEIKERQKAIDEKNLGYIQNKLDEGVIDKETAEKLSEQYSNSMENYKEFVLKMVKAIGVDKFKGIKPYDTETGKPIETDKTYTTKDITPNNSMLITFMDENGNDINLFLPGMKSIERAVEKVQIGGKYHKEYLNDLREGKPNTKKHYERLSDINRCLITTEFKGQLLDLADNINQSERINDADIVNRFTNDLSDEKHREDLIKDPKNRRELKGRYASEFGDFEVQFNTHILAHYDKKTHEIYEGYRKAMENGSNTPTSYAKLKKSQMVKTISVINSCGLEKYNQRVIEHALMMKTDFELRSLIENGDKSLSKIQEFAIGKFLKENMEARRSDVFNPKKHLPEEFKEYKSLSNIVKGMYIYNNSEAVFGKSKPHKKAKQTTIPESHTIPDDIMVNLWKMKQQMETKVS